MSDVNRFKFSEKMLLAPLLAVLSIWIVFWIEVTFKINLNGFGIKPREILGLRGVLFSPFIHGSIEHLYNNTIPLMTLTMALFYFYQRDAVKVFFYGILLSGFITWLIGRPSYHIGASGIIYVLVSYIFFKGIFAKHYRLIALSLAMVFLYGSMIWYIFPIKDGISWEGHLSGFLVGLLLAIIFKTKIVPEKKYSWEKDGYDEAEDEFLKHFDENGNFIEKSEPPANDLKVNYHYKEIRKDNND